MPDGSCSAPSLASAPSLDAAMPRKVLEPRRAPGARGGASTASAEYAFRVHVSIFTDWIGELYRRARRRPTALELLAAVQCASVIVFAGAGPANVVGDRREGWIPGDVDDEATRRACLTVAVKLLAHESGMMRVVDFPRVVAALESSVGLPAATRAAERQQWAAIRRKSRRLARVAA